MTSYPHIIVTGDSIAQLSFKSGGYGSLLADRYAGKLDVLNRGMGGYQSTQLVHKLQTDLIAPGADVKLFLIHIGTNDSAIGALQSITVQTYISNLKQIISHIRTNHSSSRIILLTPSTLDPKTCTEFEDTFQIPLPLRSPRLPGNTLRYVDACIKLGLEEHVPVVDCFRLHQKVLDEGGKTKDLFDDGLHYSAQGYSYVNQAIIEIIDKSMPELRVESMPNAFPDFWLYGVEDNAKAKWVAQLFTEIRQRAERHFAMEKMANETKRTTHTAISS